MQSTSNFNKAQNSNLTENSGALYGNSEIPWKRKRKFNGILLVASKITWQRTKLKHVFACCLLDNVCNEHVIKHVLTLVATKLPPNIDSYQLILLVAIFHKFHAKVTIGKNQSRC